MTQTTKPTEAAKKFFASPSKLSSGEKNRRFKGTVNTNFYKKSCSDQSGTSNGLT